MNRLLRQRFLALFVSLILLLVIYPVFRGLFATRLLFDGLAGLVFACAFFVVFTSRAIRLMGLVLGIPAFVGLCTSYAIPGLPHEVLSIVLHLVGAVFLAFTTVTILHAIYRPGDVTADEVYGAFCGYLMVGMVFGHLYCVIAAITPGAFAGSEAFQAEMQLDGHPRFLLTYFSFMTLTTVGYGDITPASNSAKGLATVEAVTGQFYIAVLVAELIGKRVSQALLPKEDKDKKDAVKRK